MKPQDEADLLKRVAHIERAVFGDPSDPKSPALMPTIIRLDAYMTAACWAWRAMLAALAASASTFAFGRGLGWW